MEERQPEPVIAIEIESLISEERNSFIKTFIISLSVIQFKQNEN
jgi:hypothetical protein